MPRYSNPFWFSDDGKIGYGKTPTGEVFLFDAEDFDRIKNVSWYTCNNAVNTPKYIGNSKGICIHRFILPCLVGFEIDHINNNPADNRKCNLRICTHQQNQCNQPLQSNNTSGVTGVSFYAPRNKYRARIKVSQTDIHLGYFNTMLEATQARNVGMKFMFGEFGLYNDVPDAPCEIYEKVKKICDRFADFSVCKASFLPGGTT